MPWSRRRNWVTKSSVNSKVFANLLRASMLVVSTENSPGCTPETLEKFSAYTVALDVERGWGEELAKNLLEMLQFDEAYGAGVWPEKCGRTHSANATDISTGKRHSRIGDFLA